MEDRLFAAKAKKSAIEAEQVTAENIYRVLRSFNSLYKVMDDEERRKLMEALIAEVQIYEDKKESGQWLKSIKFKLPIVEESVDISLDNQNRVDAIILDNCRSWFNLTRKAIQAEIGAYPFVIIMK